MTFSEALCEAASDSDWSVEMVAETAYLVESDCGRFQFTWDEADDDVVYCSIMMNSAEVI